MTSPQDPFATPPPGGQPPSEPYRAPDPDTTPYGSTPGRDVPPGGGYDPPTYGGNQPPSQQYGQPYQEQQYGQPYQQQQYGSVQRGPARNGLGIAALVLGILGLVTSIFVVGGALGLLAIILGALGLSRVKRGEATNGGMAIAGIVLGVLALAIAALVAFGLASFLNSPEFSSVRECLADAGNDQAAIDACAEQFETEVGG